MFRLLMALAVCMAAPAVHAAELVLEIGEVRSDSGQLRVALYDDAATFLKDDGVKMALAQRAATGRVTVRFAGLEPGKYAVALYHDENGNSELDANLLGIPIEGTGFSRDARATFGPPSFADAMVTVRADEIFVTSVTLSY